MAAFFAAVSGVTAALTFAVLTLAFVHEWGFFFIVGRHFQSLLSFSDYFTSAIGWLPWSIVGLGVGAIFNFGEQRQFGFASIWERDAFYAKNRKLWFRDRFPFWLIVWSAFFGGGFQFLFGDWYSDPVIMSVEFLFMFWWMRACVWFDVHEKSPTRGRPHVLIVILVVPVMLVFAFAGGIRDGASAVRAKEPNVTAKLENEQLEKSWVMLRALASGILFKEPAKDQIRFIKWADIAAIQEKAPPLSHQGLLCRVFGVACLAK
jgi:hypothetical protein